MSESSFTRAGRASLCLLLLLSAAAPPRAAGGGLRVRPQTNPAPEQRPELVLQTGHASKVDAMAFDPDGRLLASGSADNTIRLWDAATGHELRALRGHGGGVAAVAFGPGGKLLASGGNDRAVRLWEVASGRAVDGLSGLGGSVKALAFEGAGRLIAVGSSDNSVGVWEPGGGAPRRLGAHAGWVVAVAFSPGGRLLASGSLDGTIKLWEVSSGRELSTLRGHEGRVHAVAFSPDGATLASAGGDRTVRVWEVAPGRHARTLTGHAAKVIGVAFTQGGQRLASISSDRNVRLWDAAAWRELQTVAHEGDFEFEAAAFSPDGQRLASSNGNKTVELRAALAGGGPRVLETRSSGVYAAAFSHGGRWLAAGNKDNTINLWEAATGQQVTTLAGHSGWVTALAFRPERDWLASGSMDGTVALWEASTGRRLRALAGHADSVYAVAFSPDGRRVASGSLDATVRLWDAETGRLLQTFKGHGAEVTGVVFSGDGSQLISGGADKTVRFWDAATGAEVRVLSEHSGAVYALALSRDGRWLASAGADRDINVRDAATGRVVSSLRGHADTVNALAFGPGDRWLASGGNDQTVRLWDWREGREARTLVGNSHHVNAVAFSPDGSKLLSGGEDGSLRLWDAADGTPLATLTSLRESREWLVATPEGLFDGSPAAWNQILWRFENTTTSVAPVEVFFNEFYYPGLLAELLAGRAPRPAQDISRRDRRQPVVELSAGPAGAQPVSARAVKVRLELKSAPAGAKDVRLFRNGSLVKLWRGDAAGAASPLEATVPVTAGENHFTAYAFNRDNVKSQDATLVVRGDESLRRAGTAYILAVGVNTYANPRFNLRYAVADARDFAEEVRRSQTQLGRFGRVEVVQLLDPEATKANILAGLRRLAGSAEPLPAGAPESLKALRAAEPEDVVVVYFAGHGMARGQRFYLIPHDLGFLGAKDELGEAALLKLLSSSISDEELQAAVEGVDAGRLLMVIDACYSGQALEAEDRRRGPMNSKGLAQMAYEKGMYVLTASQSHQAALEVEQLNHGLLTYVLVEEGLKGMAADAGPRDGVLAAREWLDFAAERVPRVQEEKMIRARELGVKLTFGVGGAGGPGPDRGDTQRPRAFYRREPGSSHLIIARRAAAL